MLQPNAACPGQHSSRTLGSSRLSLPRSLSWALRTSWYALALGLGSEKITGLGWAGCLSTTQARVLVDTALAAHAQALSRQPCWER